jgi:glycosyltransferase involved in cell wall biosynthesis
MKIAVDARELCGKPTGVGRYLRELLAEWNVSSEAGRHEWWLYAPCAPELPARFAGRVQVLPGRGGTRWEQWTLGRALAARRPDVLFAPGYSAPLLAPCPIVVTIHDVSFAARPDWFTPREGARRRGLTRWSGRRARLVLTVSEFSKREIVSRFAIAAGRVRVTPHGVRRFLTQARAREPLVLYVGSIFERRHVDRLVEAFVTRVADALPDARLEIVGENRLSSGMKVDRALATASDGVRARVRFRSYVDDVTLEELYGRARVFAFLSEYEGFGLTPLEAIAHGVPPVVLDTDVAREVYGPAAEYLVPGPTLVSDLGQALVHLLSDPGAHERLVAMGAEVLARYDWSRTASDTLEALEEAAGAR